ncbi:hypothetical protein FG379_001386 [Cryptosporidium bovis]|uniref:uncharacterized protein n=1 Tax=Cryptosporidium bovis TaxID=310047 RepID=UPI00351A06EF|nr:hypothetical protein FG379_001386 [Cryptosporidium bovis]
MDIQNEIHEVVFLENLDSDSLHLQNKSIENSYHDISLKENFPINDKNAQSNMINSYSNSQLNGKYYSKTNNIHCCIQNNIHDNYNENGYQAIKEENLALNTIDYSYTESKCNYFPGYKNFRLEWDKDTDSLYIIIPSVDSLDHWMMLFLQPIGITNDSFCLKNCCTEGNCDFKIRLDDERLLLYPDLLKDISEFISLQSKLWSNYVSTVVMRDRDSIDNFIQSNGHFSNNSTENCYEQIYSCHKLPNINVFLNDVQNELSSDNFIEDNRLICCEKEISQNCSVIYDYKQCSRPNKYYYGLDLSACKLTTADLHHKSANSIELCNKSTQLSCLTTNISDSNITTADSTMIPVLTSDNSNNDESYFNTN